MAWTEEDAAGLYALELYRRRLMRLVDYLPMREIDGVNRLDGFSVAQKLADPKEGMVYVTHGESKRQRFAPRRVAVSNRPYVQLGSFPAQQSRWVA